MSSIKDVAKKAGVSLSAVSLAYHKPHQLSEQTRIRILQAADELGYKPNLNKLMNVLKSTAILVPDNKIQQTHVPLTAKLMDILFDKNHATTVLEYTDASDLNRSLKKLESENIVKGAIIISNEQNELSLSEYNFPVITVSPHTIIHKTDIGISYMRSLLEHINTMVQQGRKKMGFVIEREYFKLDYIQSIRQHTLDQYAKIITPDLPGNIFCVLDGNVQDFETISRHHQENSPDFWIFLGSYCLNMVQTVLEEPLYGYVLLEEDVLCAIKPIHHLSILRRPLTDLAVTVVDQLFYLIDNNIKTITQQISIVPKLEQE